MTTEAVELTCRHVDRYEDRGGGTIARAMIVCDRPIRQRTSGPCVNCRHDHLDSFAGEGPQPRCMDLDYTDEGEPDKACECVDYDPGYDHVDLEGACAECGLAEGAYEEGVEGLMAVHHQDFESGDHDYVPPVLPLPHEATV